MAYEQRKHDGSLPIVGVNTFLDPDGADVPRNGGARPRHRGGEAVPAGPPRGLPGAGTATRLRRRSGPAAGGDVRRQRVRRADGRGALLLARPDQPGVLRGRRPVPPQRVSTGPGHTRPIDSCAAVGPDRGGARHLGGARVGRRGRRDGGGHLADAGAADRAGPGGRRAASARPDLRPLRAARCCCTFSRTARCPMSKIGARLQVHPASVTNVVDRLEAAGLVRRRPHPNDRRAMLVAITDEGRAVADRPQPPERQRVPPPRPEPGEGDGAGVAADGPAPRRRRLLTPGDHRFRWERGSEAVIPPETAIITSAHDLMAS